MNYTTARNIILYDELAKILPVFNSAHIEIIVLAGAALGATVYPSIADRPMGDIDLLIRHRDKQAIGGLLENLGYVLDTARSDEAHYSKTIGEFTLHIDCHTDLSHYLDDRALAGVWARAQTLHAPRSKFTLSAANVLHSLTVLSPEDSLIYTAVDSAIYHGRITDNTINDIELIIKHYGNSLNEPSPLVGEGRVRGVRCIDWPLVIQLIKSYRLETPIYILFDAGRQEGIPIPDAVMNALHPRRRSLEYRLYKTILYAPRSEFTLSAANVLYAADDLVRILRFLTRPAARWEIFWNSFFPSWHFINQQYNLIPSKKRGRGVLPLRSEFTLSAANVLYALRLEFTLSAANVLLYPVRALGLLWRMNKAMYQLTMRML